MKIRIFTLITAAVLAFMSVGAAALGEEQEELSDKLIRLHVVGNSDSEEDQRVKLVVRDAVLEELETLLNGADGRDEAANTLKSRLDTIEDAANAALLSEGFAYTASAQLVKEWFPTRQYETFSLPAGSYVSLRVELGDAEGKNWWCVVYPQLCTGAAMDFSELTGSERALITLDSEGFIVKFKAIELVEKLIAKIKGL